MRWQKFSTGELKWLEVVGSGFIFIYFYGSILRYVMITFIGDFVCKPDAKGRIVLPAHFKKMMGAAGQDGFVVRKSLFDDCLDLIPQSEWQKEVEVLESQLNSFKQKDKRLKRALYRSTAEVSLDANGRFLIPKRLLDLIGVEGDVMLLGVGSTIEFWDKQKLEAIEMDPNEVADLAEELLGSASINKAD